MFTLPRMIDHLRIPLSLYVISSTILETRIQRLRTQTYLKIEAEVSLKMPYCIRTVCWTQRVLWATKYYGLHCTLDIVL